MSIDANMSILDGMRKIIPEENVFITVGNASFNVSKVAYELIGKPTGLEIYIGSGKVALKPGNDFKTLSIIVFLIDKEILSAYNSHSLVDYVGC